MIDKETVNKDSKRITSIDIFKFLAVLAVLNSHLDPAYASYSFLATGGAFGDALFFFASGFMLFRGPSIRFDNFYKKRISRIYPTVFIVAIVGALFFNKNDNIITILLSGGGWFVSCIMIYYVLLWIIKRWFFFKIKWIWVIIALVTIVWFYVGYDKTTAESMYGNTYFKWCFFFIFMLQGAVMGLNPLKYQYKSWKWLMLGICIAIWYGILFLANKYVIAERFQYISIFPLLGVTYYTFCICNSNICERIYNRKYLGQLIFIIGGLSLECYLIQFFLISDKLNYIFPLNIPILVLTILLVAYGVNFCSNVFSQTFCKGEYEWDKIFLRKR